MPKEDRPNPSHIERQRVPLESRVSLKFKEFRGFLTEYSSNISLGGMFLKTDKPQPPGSVFDFEFKLADEFSLIHGIGEVVWARFHDEGPEHPPGMGVRFLHLDGAGEKLIRRMVTEHVEKGGVPFELGAADELADTEAQRTERREGLRQDLAAFDPSPRALGQPEPAPDEWTPPAAVETGPSGATPPPVDIPESDESPLDETVILSNPLAAADPDPPAPTPPSAVPAPAAPAQTSFLDPLSQADTVAESMSAADLANDAVADAPTATMASVSRDELDSDPDPPETPFDSINAEAEPESAELAPLPPGFDEVTRALGRSESSLRYADERLNEERQELAAEREGAAPLAAPPPPSSSQHSASWQVPDPIEPYHHTPDQKKGGNGFVIGVATVIIALIAVGYYFSTQGSDDPFAPERSETSANAATAEETDPAPSATTSTLAVDEATEAGVDEPPTLESLVGLPEDSSAPQDRASEPAGPVEPEPRPEPSDQISEPLSDPDSFPPPPSGSPATVIEEIRWVESDRTTVVTLVGNGVFSEEAYTTSRMSGRQPREILYLRGIETGYRQGQIQVGTPSVQRIRLGHHVKASGPELHIVFDLSHIDSKLFTVDVQGNEMVITLGQT